VTKLASIAPEAERGLDRALAMTTAGVLANFQSDYVSAEAMFREALGIYRNRGERRRAASVLGNLAIIAMDRQDYAVSGQLVSEALIIAREEHDTPNVAIGLLNLASIALYTGEPDKADALAREAVLVAREVGRYHEAEATLVLAQVKAAQGDSDSARAMLATCLEWMRELGNTRGTGVTRTRLGAVAVDVGDVVTAQAHLRDALRIQRELQDRVNMADALEEFGAATSSIDGPAYAARIWGRSELLRIEIGVPQDPPRSKRFWCQVAAARVAQADHVAFDQAWSEGKALTLDDLLRQILDQ